MRVVILGCGKLGLLLANQLLEKNHQVIIIDKDEDAFKGLKNQSTCERVVGSAFIDEVLRQSFEKKVDVFVALTGKDNINIMFGQLVRSRFSVPRVIARISDPTLAGVYEELGMETICPTNLALNLLTEVLSS